MKGSGGSIPHIFNFSTDTSTWLVSHFSSFTLSERAAICHWIGFLWYTELVWMWWQESLSLLGAQH